MMAGSGSSSIPLPTDIGSSTSIFNFPVKDMEIIEEMKKKLTIAIVCMSNVNRSMEAHHLLSKNGFNVRSFGVGDRVRIPGLKVNKPNVYDFGTAYNEIIRDMQSQNRWYYVNNGLMSMMERNSLVKTCPERFQDCLEKFDIIITVNRFVMSTVISHIQSLTPSTPGHLTHILNIEIEDSLDSAMLGSYLIFELLQFICKTRNLSANISKQIGKFQAYRSIPVNYSFRIY